ncbi:MAG TPA: hypothetical protein VF210_13660 [Pseudomonadales bacterium]
MQALVTGIRWLLVPVSAVAVIAASVVAGRAAVALADRRCPTESLIGGSCVEPWHTSVVEAAIYGAVAVCVAGLVILPARIAPQLQRTVAVLLFLAAVGCAGAAFVLTGWADLLRPLLVAVPVGALALWWVWSRRPAR